MSYRARLNQMFERLQAHPEIEVESFVLGNPATEAEVAAAQEWTDYGFLPGLEDFAREVGSVQLAWRARQGHDDWPFERYAGRVEILGISRVYDDWFDEIWFEGEPNPSRIRGTFPMDMGQQPEHCIAILDDEPGPQIGFLEIGSSLAPMGLTTFDAYFECLVQSRGLHYWPRALVSPSWKSSRPTGRNILTALEELFPDADRSLFRPRTETAELWSSTAPMGPTT